MCVVGLGRAEHVYMWMEWCGEQRRTTSETMPVDLGMCHPQAASTALALAKSP